ncbi:MAG TPA: 4Fe-4S binding protein [Anaerohalosphaeraceae bacterium]|nr:4Fe-4S binding protein [Anaerohalosphaeraceae bacterium]
MKVRHLIQTFFLIWILTGVFILRRNVETWCPMGGVESLYSYFVEGGMYCSLRVSNFFMLAAVILLTLCFKRAFCGYLCPLGAIAEWMRVIARKLGFRQFSIPPAVNSILSLLKYAVLAVMLWLTWRAAELVIRSVDPCYAVITLGEEAKWTTYAVLVLFVISAFFISMPFCRWLCPFAAVMNPFSRFGATRIVRDPQACNNCGACSKACPMAIQVASVKQVVSADCIACMECVDKCPRRQRNALQWMRFGRVWVKHPGWTIFAGIAISLLAVYLASVFIPLPSFVYAREGQSPQHLSTCHLKIEGVTCGGSAKLFVFFLDRKDISEVPGYLKVSMSPAAGFIDVRIDYDSAQTTPQAIQDAISEPYFDEAENRWRMSPFKIQGYDMLETAIED